MINHRTLNIYLSSLYCRYFSYTIFVLAFILSLSNVFDVLQKLQSANLSSQFFWKLVLYKVPYLLNSISPLVSFISMLFFIKYLITSNEIVVIIGNGLSLQRVITIAVITSGLIGLLMLLILNPIGAYGLKQYGNIENAALGNKYSDHIVMKNNSYFFENYNQENRIIYIKSVNQISSKLNEVTVLFLDSEKKLSKRIDAKEADLLNGVIRLSEVKIFNNNTTKLHGEIDVATSLSLENISSDALTPEMTSIWNISKLINDLSSMGVTVIDYQIYYYKQLCKPIFMMGTTLLASCFISLGQRNNAQKKMFALGSLSSFIIYSVIEVISRILIYNNMAPSFAIFLPIILLVLISNLIILHLNDK
ncbi:MAG: LptF/LptG family permease [Janthinobacterium lividum]